MIKIEITVFLKNPAAFYRSCSSISYSEHKTHYDTCILLVINVVFFNVDGS